jgi:O-antigen/teichoic acid export membrane protein
LNRPPSLTRSSLLAKNTALNLFGYAAPLVVAVFAIPAIVAGMGTDRFGILTLAWVLIGYLGLLDLGLGRALTMVVAEKLGMGQSSEIPTTIWTALLAMLLISVFLCLMVLLGSRWLIYDVINIPGHLEQETYRAFLVLVLFIPVVIVSVGLRGILEAYQRFDLVNAVRVPLGIFSFAAPLAVLPFTVKLPAIILVLGIGRTVAAGFQFICCCRIVPGLLAGISLETKKFWMLMRFGGWMTVTNIVNPILVYVDRLFIGAMISVTAVAFYATPSEVIIKLTLLSGALMSVLFPAIATSFRVDRQRSAMLLERGLKYIFLSIFPIVLFIVTFAPEGLAMWLDDRFVQNSSGVTRILAIGIFFACLGQIPYAFIQGAARPDLTGKLHFAQFPPFILMLVVSIKWAGIDGVAMIWTFRFMIDTLVMYVAAQHLLGEHRLDTKRNLAVVVSAFIAIMVLVVLPSLLWRVLGFLLVNVVFAWVGLRYILSTDEKNFLVTTLQSCRRGKGKRRA